MMGTYLAVAALEQLDRAQAELERHLVVAADGRCRGCGQIEPCTARGRVEAVFLRYGRLPKRRPGATHVGLRRMTAADRLPWFGA